MGSGRAHRTINGQKAVAINDTTKGGTLYVSTTGTPYPIQISKTGSEAGIVKFENWNSPRRSPRAGRSPVAPAVRGPSPSPEAKVGRS